jgi:hypothetical protein
MTISLVILRSSCSDYLIRRSGKHWFGEEEAASMIADPSDDRVPCAKCATLIQPTTAAATGGICRSCERGRVNCVRCGVMMVRRDMVPVDEQVCRDCMKKQRAAAPKPVEIEYNGVVMLKSWMDSIVAAQEIVTVELRVGERPRIRFADKKAYAGGSIRSCPDCAVVAQQFHVPGCDSEECPNCQGQLISCGCLLQGTDES